MTPEELLIANVDALTRAQGITPMLGGLPPSIRLVAAGHDDVGVEVQGEGGEWHHLDGPSAVTDAWLPPAATDAGQVIMTGVGLGHALERAEHLPINRILAIEPDPGLATVFLSRRDWRRWFDKGRLRLLIGPDYRGAADSARFFDGLADVPIAAHPLRQQFDPAAIARAGAVADRVVRGAKANGVARQKFAGPYLLQTLGNLRAIAREPGVETLNRAFEGTAAIVVGAGPSLDHNLEDIARFRDRAVVIAADTALRPLVTAGVSPHIVVSADPSELNARHLTAVAAEAVMLVAEGSVHPSGLRSFAGRTFFFRVSQHEPWPWLAEGGITRGELRTWGSVLTSAFDLARYMGCGPIVFAGADMAFTDGRPYCRGTIYDAVWDEWIAKGYTWEQLRLDYMSRQPEVWLDDVHGERVRTAPHLVSFRDWLVDQAGRTDGLTCINATGGGILHGAGIQQAAMADALAAAAPTHRPDAVLRRRYSRHDSAKDQSRLNDLLAAREESSVPYDRWQAFAAGTVTKDAITSALNPGT